MATEATVGRSNEDVAPFDDCTTTIRDDASTIADDATTVHGQDENEDQEDALAKKQKDLALPAVNSEVSANPNTSAASSGLGSRLKRMLRSPAADRAQAILAKRPPETEKDYYINKKTGKREKYIKEYYPLNNQAYSGYWIAKGGKTGTS